MSRSIQFPAGKDREGQAAGFSLPRVNPARSDLMSL
jgi:hypothetical protein